MRRETADQRVRRGLTELALWGGFIALILALGGAFIFVLVTLAISPQARFVDEENPPAPKKGSAPARSQAFPPPKTPPVSAAEKPQPGLVARYYAFSQALTDFPELDRLSPKVRRIEKTVNYESTDAAFAGTNLSENFAVRWSGLLRVPRDGAYTLYTISDDGSRLYIGGKRVVNNPGLHSMEEQRGRVDLKKGDHPIRIDFFEGSGGAGCKVLWEGPGIRKAVLPADVLFHRESD